MQHQPFFKRQPLALAVATLLASGVTSTSAQSATRTWDGNGGDDRWSYVGASPFNTNWTDNASVPLPVSGESLVFQGSTRLTPSNDRIDLSIAGITFNPSAGAFTLGGNAITSIGNITNSSSNLQTLNLPVTVGNSQTWNGGTAGLKVSGAVTLGNQALTLSSQAAIASNVGNFTVGDSGAASLSLQSGSSVSDITGTLGNANGSSGTATVDGAGSLWSNSDRFYAGFSGNGSLIVQNGGQVSDANGYVGYFGTSHSTATVTGAGSQWANSADIKVGILGQGTLNILNGGLVQDTTGYIGYSGGGLGGTVTVDGVGSTWSNSHDLVVGLASAAALNVNAGGTASVGNALSIGSAGVLNLGGGTLQAASASKNAGGQFNWTTGTVKLNAASVGNTTSLFGTALSLGDGQILDVGTLTLNTGGNLALTAADRIADTTALVLNGGSFNLNNNNETLASLAGSGGSINLGIVGDTNSVSRLTVGGNNADTSYAGALNGVTGGLFSASILHKTGTGSMTLAGVSTYANTVVTGGGSLILSAGGQVNNDKAAVGLRYSGLVGSPGGTATVTGANSRWNVGTELSLGYTSTLNIENGGQVNSGVGYLGKGRYGVGNATVSGAYSTWNSDTLYVGDSSPDGGTLTIRNGGQVNSGLGSVGRYSTGIATVTGGSLWHNRDDFYVGDHANGTLNIQVGSVVVSTKNTYLGYAGNGTGTAMVSGAEASWINDFYGFYVGHSGNGTLTVADTGLVFTYDSYLGYNGSGNGTVTVTGGSSEWHNSNKLYVGFGGSGTLNIENGGWVSDSNGYLGFNSGSTGTATVTGANSIWNTNNTLYVGNAGSGTLTIANGGAATMNALSIGSAGVLNLSGGSLQAATASKAAGGQFNWTGGTVNLNSATVGDATGLFGTSLNLGAAQTLNVGTLTNTGAIQLAGGAIVAPKLNLGGGSISGSALDVGSIGTLSGFGTVSSAINGGTAVNSIVTNGGNLLLGDVNSVNGFDFGGNLLVGANQVNLLDQNQANLGASTFIDDGGRLNAANGAALGSGESLSYTGNASILGNFSNNGAVSGSGGALTFLNDVNGAGSFAGDIVFHAGYNPGNSPAAIDFNGGNALYDASSVLTLEILGATAGSEYDQLLNIDHLAFDGILNLVFGPNFSPSAGQSFDLFGFNSFSGSLAADRITVSGIDRNRLNLGNLAGSGRLQIAAVPLPAGAWLFASGLALLGLALRKNV